MIRSGALLAICLVAACMTASVRPTGIVAAPAEGHPEDAAAPQSRPEEPAAAPADPQHGPARPAANPLLAEGWQEMRYANYPKALKAFERALAEAKSDEDRAEAVFGLALHWQSKPTGADLPRALSLYERVLGEFPDTRAAPWATLALARAADLPPTEENRRVDEARERYRAVLSKWPDSLAADEAAIRLAQTYMTEIADPAAVDRGAKILEDRLAARPRNDLAAPMHLLLGGYRQGLEQFREAIRHWIAADEAGIPGLSDRANVYYAIGCNAERRLKDYALAAKWYQKLVTDTPRDAKYYIAKLAAERCRKAVQGAAAPAKSAAGEGGSP